MEKGQYTKAALTAIDVVAICNVPYSSVAALTIIHNRTRADRSKERTSAVEFHVSLLVDHSRNLTGRTRP